jgi:hypothetical protein
MFWNRVAKDGDNNSQHLYCEGITHRLSKKSDENGRFRDEYAEDMPEQAGFILSDECQGRISFHSPAVLAPNSTPRGLPLEPAVRLCPKP